MENTQRLPAGSARTDFSTGLDTGRLRQMKAMVVREDDCLMLLDERPDHAPPLAPIPLRYSSARRRGDHSTDLMAFSI
jgi:hypothetical protein